MSIYVKDVNGNIHEACPRCHDIWIYISEPDIVYVSCNKCGMIASLNSYATKEYVLSFDFLTDKKLHTISWFRGRCVVSTELIEKSKRIPIVKLPLCQFDITLDKLQTYLLFS